MPEHEPERRAVRRKDKIDLPLQPDAWDHGVPARILEGHERLWRMRSDRLPRNPHVVKLALERNEGSYFLGVKRVDQFLVLRPKRLLVVDQTCIPQAVSIAFHATHATLLSRRSRPARGTPLRSPDCKGMLGANESNCDQALRTS